MTTSSRDALFRATRWRLTLLNAAVLCAILLLLSGFLYLVEVATTDAEITRLLTQTVQQEREEDLAQILKSSQPIVDPPRPFSPAPLQAFFLLADTQGRVHEGAASLLAGLPNQGALQQVLETGRPNMRELTVRGFHLRLETVPVFDRTGKPLGVIQAYVSLAGRDAELARLLFVLLIGGTLAIGASMVAARFLAARALIPMQWSFAQQEQFVADASHELRAPLTLLHADLEVLQRALVPLPLSAHAAGTAPTESMEDASSLLCLDHAEVEIIDEMSAEIEQMNTLIADLLTLARYDAGVHPFPTQVVGLAPLLSALVDRLSLQATEANLILHLQLPDDPASLAVMGDPTALRRLFLVLLHNAITYTPAGGQIWLGAQRIAGKWIEVTVRDTGRGIAPEDLPHVFKRFYRADKARTRHPPVADEQGPGGTGLGLAITQSIVERHGGTITASSAGEGKGSIFTVLLKRAFSLPVATGTAAADSV